MDNQLEVHLNPQRQARARKYAIIRRRLMLASLIIGSAYLLLWVLLDWAPQVRDLIHQISTGRAPDQRLHWILQLILFTVVLSLPWSLFDLPLSYYTGYVLPHRFELSNQTLRNWMGDQFKGALVSIILGLPLLIGVFSLLRYAPNSWWIWGAAGYSLFAIILTAISPVLLMPLFYRFKQLGEDHADVELRLLELSERAGTYVQGVFTFDMSTRTRAANAALAGLGRSRRIILGDTLLENFSPEEIETILAHEMAHHVHRDIPLGIAVQVPLTFLFFYVLHRILMWAVPVFGLEGVADPASLPLLALVFSGLGLLTMPLVNAWSRWRERMADDYALEITRKPRAFASAMTRLANQNLAEVDPEPWVVFLLHSHPPLSQRIQRAHTWRISRSGEA